MKKLFCIFLALAMVFSLVSCGVTADEGNSTPNTSPNTTANDPGGSGDGKTTVRISIDLDPGNLGPFATNNTGRKQVLYEIYQPLAFCEHAGEESVNYIAKEITQIDEYTFNVEIWDNVTDSDGNHITADDVVFSYTNEESVAKSQTMTYVESITALDDYNVEFVLNSTTVKVLDRVLGGAFIVSQKAYEESGDGMASRAVGTGPYVIAEYVEGSEIVLEARDDYWKAESELTTFEQENVERIEFYIIAEAAQQVISLETDAIDMVTNMSADQAARFASNDEFTVLTDLSNTCYTLFFNCNEASVCRDLAVRQAICYAIDTQGIIDGALDGEAEKAYAYGSSSFYDIYDAWDDGNYYEYDPDKAVSLLESAGYGQGELTVRILLRSLELDQNVALIIQGYLDAVGINASIDVYEETIAKTYVRDHTTWDVYIRQAGQDYAMIHGYGNDWLSTSWDSGIGYNGIHDETFEQLINTCLESATSNEETMTQLHYYMKDNVYAYGMFIPLVYTVGRSDVMCEIGLNPSFWLIPGACTYTWNK